ncbi:MAG: ABC transporter permease [Thiogranum sp.]|nr:ABC transporter permease [Thiogranum sp.]
MPADVHQNQFRRLAENIGGKFAGGVEAFGYSSVLLAESLFWIFAGCWLQQCVRVRSVVAEMMNIGVRAIPVLAILAMANGAMMAMQGIATLRGFGAEVQVIAGIALSVTREFGVLITGIVVAGRSGSAIAARIGTMQMAQEIDALRVIGVEPVRYLVSPILIAMLVMMPLLTILANAMAIVGGGIFVTVDLQINFSVYLERVFAALVPGDLVQGLIKSLVFGVLITLVASSNGFSATGGAEGLGRATTRSVVLCIGAIVIADMIFTFFLSR